MDSSHHLVKTVRNLPIQVSDTEIKKTLVLHPEFPSLLSLSDALHTWRVDNLAVKLSTEDLEEMDFPLIAHYEELNEVDCFVIINKVENDKIVFTHPQKGKYEENKTEFVKKWSGLSLIIDIKSFSGDNLFKENILQERIDKAETAIIYASLAGLFLWFIGFSQVPTIPFSLSCIGLGISLALLKEEYGRSPELLKKICQHDCRAITSSSAGKLFSWLSWSEIGLIYFLGTIITYVFISFNILDKSTLSFLLFLHGLALLYIPYSIWFQWLYAKRWCPLCIATLSVMVLLFLSEYFMLESPFSFITNVPYLGIIAFITTLITWFIIKPFWKNSEENILLKARMKYFDTRYDIINLLRSSEAMMPTYELKEDLRIGKEDAPNTFILFINPYCIYCAEAFKNLIECQELFPDDMNIKFCLIGSWPRQKKTIKHLLMLSDTPYIKEAITDWFKDPHYTAFAKKYPTEINHEQMDIAHQQHQNYANLVDVEGTPEIYFNGRRWSLPLGAKDLLLHIHHLIENSK